MKLLAKVIGFLLAVPVVILLFFLCIIDQEKHWLRDLRPDEDQNGKPVKLEDIYVDESGVWGNFFQGAAVVVVIVLILKACT
jgi:hypothetical protein